jgi:hypothetical protein
MLAVFQILQSALLLLSKYLVLKGHFSGAYQAVYVFICFFVMWGRTYRRRCDVRRATERAARAQEEDTTRG